VSVPVISTGTSSPSVTLGSRLKSPSKTSVVRWTKEFMVQVPTSEDSVTPQAVRERRRSGHGSRLTGAGNPGDAGAYTKALAALGPHAPCMVWRKLPLFPPFF
jgi:hypothetical protein